MPRPYRASALKGHDHSLAHSARVTLIDGPGDCLYTSALSRGERACRARGSGAGEVWHSQVVVEAEHSYARERY
jgi:hypothetical protein